MSQFVYVSTTFNAHELTLDVFGVCDSFASRPDRQTKRLFSRLAKTCLKTTLLLSNPGL